MPHMARKTKTTKRRLPFSSQNPRSKRKKKLTKQERARFGARASGKRRKTR